MNQAWPDTYNEGYILNSNLNLLTKLTSSSRITEFKDILPWKISSPNQHESSHKLCNETEYPVLSLTEKQWKLRKQHDQNFPNERKPL